MYGQFLCFLLFCLVGNVFGADPTSNEKRILDLEKNVAILQTQSRSSEQKYAALISNILTKLTGNSKDILDLKSDLNAVQLEHNQTLQELNWTREQLRVLTSQYTDLKTKYDSVSRNVILTRSQLNTAVENITDLVDMVSNVQSYVGTLPKILNSSVPLHQGQQNTSLLIETIQLVQKQENRVVMLEHTVNQTRLTVKTVKGDILKNTQSMKTNAAHVSHMQVDVTGLKSQGTHFQAVLQPLQSLVAGHTNQIKEAAKQALQALTRLGALQTKHTGDWNKYNQKIRDLSGRITTNAKNIATLSKDQAASKALTNSLQTVVTAANKTIQAQSTTLLTLQRNTVTSKQRLFFRIYLAGDRTFGDDIPLAFPLGANSVYGSYYKTQTGTFTASAAGIYLFWIHVALPPNSARTTIRIVKQGDIVVSGTAGIAPIVALVRLQIHEQVWFTKHSQGSVTFLASKQTRLGGLLLFLS